MILRRFSQHIKEQNWFAVGLEVIVVIVGIFLGMQVTEWNEERKERIDERLYIERIQSDVMHSIERTNGSIEHMLKHANLATVVLNSLQKCSISPEDRESFATGLYHLGKVNPAFMMRTAIDELRSTGKWQIIRNVELRSKIMNMLVSHASVISIFSQVEGRLLPHINYVDSVVSYDITKPIGGSSIMTLDKLYYDFESLCRDKRFFNAVSSVRNYVFDLANQNTRVNNVFRSVGDALTLEIKNM